MPATTHPCDDHRLRLLISGDESHAGYQAAARHVEACPACQQRLTTLAGDTAWWTEAKDHLSDGDGQRWAPDASWSASESTPAASSSRGAQSPGGREWTVEAVRKLLAEPSHPEMLGRLGRYDIERVIGSGGMGVVLKAHDSELNRPVAIKVLAAHLAHVGAARRRFAREGRAAAAVVHEHVAAIYNVDVEGESPFLVMQYVPGRSLQARVDTDGPLAVEEILRIGRQAAAGLAAAHAQGLVHRDVKPANILLEESVERAILTDFGLARAVDDASLTHTGVVAGTPDYMSPEQAAGAAVDHRSDLFSLGGVLYFMATGRPPFRASGSLAVLNRVSHEPHRPVWQVNADVPDALSDVIDKLLEKKPARRFATAQEVEDRLATLLACAQSGDLPSRRAHRKPIKRYAAIAAACALVLVTAVAFWQWRTEPNKPAASDVTTPPPPSESLDKSVAALQDFATATQEYDATVSETQGNLQRAGGGAFQQGGDAAWGREVEAIHSGLDELEAGLELPWEGLEIGDDSSQ